MRAAVGAAARWTVRGPRRRLQRHALVLNYHRIAAPDGPDPWRLCVHPERFRAQLAVLGEVAEVVPLAELDARATSTGARPVVALTFDDGYADACTTALPLLAEARFPATFFITTGAVGRGEPFWWDALAARFTDAAELRHHQARLLGLDDAARRDALATLLGSQDATLASPLDAAQLATLAAAPGIEVGAHTLSHRFLRGLDPAAQRAEVEGSLRECERLTGRRPTSFAYPYGALDARTPGIVAAAGFARACTTAPDLHWAGGDPYLIPRFAVHDLDGAAFRRRLSWYWLP